MPLFRRLYEPLLIVVASVRGSRMAGTLSSDWSVGAGGKACSGPMLGMFDSCPTVRVTKYTEGKTVEVRLKCFSKKSRKPDELAGWGEDGLCFIPKNSNCDSHSQCRPGTSCMLRSHPEGDYACQEVAAGHTFTETSPAEVARCAAAVVRSMAKSLLASDLLRRESDPGKFMDTRSGAVSPFVAKPALARQVLDAVVASFESADLKGDDAASRSGALFVFSGDKRFIAKRVKEAAYEEFVYHLIGPLTQHAGLVNAVCQTDSWDSCWAEAALNRTALNVPVLTFIHDDYYWVVMAAAAPLRGQAISGSPENLQPWGKATFYDLKPVWAKSAARPDFMKKVTELGINPVAEDAPAEMRTQWVELQSTLDSDIDFLSREGSSAAPFIDYSLLFEVYAPGRRVDTRGKHCLEARSCFESSPVGCRVVCVSIIDFFMRYTVARQVESVFKWFKFHDYAEKTKELLKCSFTQRLAFLGNGLEIHGLISGAGAVPKEGLVTVETNINRKVVYTQRGCMPYLNMACRGIGAHKTRRMKHDCGTFTPDCMEATCTWEINARYLDQCGSWMLGSCVKELEDYKRIHVDDD